MFAHIVTRKDGVIIQHDVEVVQVQVPGGKPYTVGNPGASGQGNPVSVIYLDVRQRGIPTGGIAPVQRLLQRVAAVQRIVPPEDDPARASLAVARKADEPRRWRDHHAPPVEDRLRPVLKVHHGIRTELHIAVPRYRNTGIDVETPVDVRSRLAERK